MPTTIIVMVIVVPIISMVVAVLLMQQMLEVAIFITISVYISNICEGSDVVKSNEYGIYEEVHITEYNTIRAYDSTGGYNTYKSRRIDNGNAEQVIGTDFYHYEEVSNNKN